MKAIQIPAWLIALAGLVLIFVVLERLYHAKVPVEVFGIKLNQPAVTVPGLKLRVTQPISANTNQTKSLGLKQDQGFCYLTEIAGELKGSRESVKVYVDNGVWVLQVSTGSGSGVYA